MYYELYIDVLFLVNFLMDYILLLFVWRVLHCKTTHIRIAAGAALGALLYCILILLPIPNAILEFILFHLGVNTCMIQVGFKIKDVSVLLKALILVYIGAFFMGGIMQSMYQYVRIGSLFAGIAIAGYYLALAMWKFLSRLRQQQAVLLEVEIEKQHKKMKIKALVDTGNMLCDSLTGKPVSILDKETAKHILGDETEKIRYIPFQTIGNKEGVLPVFYLDRISILGKTNKYYEKPLVGISQGKISESGEYEMILNPNLF